MEQDFHGVMAPGNTVLFCSALCTQHQKLAKKASANEKMAKKSKVQMEKWQRKVKCKWKNGNKSR
jgi:hypothetical protein